MFIFFLMRLGLSIGLIILFYFYLKLFIIKTAAQITKLLQITRYYSFEMAKGVIELPIIVVAHVGFAFFLVAILGFSPSHIGLMQPSSWLLIPLGALLGVGMMGLSSLLCRSVIEILRQLRMPNHPYEVKDWLIMVRSGWLRHHLQTLEIMPIPLALIITLGQVCGEEMVFRGALLHYFLPHGPWVAILISTILFMCMQIFHMPSLLSSLFSMIGAMVIGVVDGIVYLHVSNLIPLIVAHITFFAVAVL
ncbi:MAG: CPBP family intramembrane glutamic endopeptidase [Gammaproteobacteria bacterium]